MTSELSAATLPAGAGAADGLPEPGRIAVPEPLLRKSGSLTRWAGPACSLLILAAVAYQLRSIDFAELHRLLPRTASFWIIFLVAYAALPVSEWLIFRRLWNIPVEGFAALLRKRVSNELLLGYSGEVYFYAWARRVMRITAAPFGAIKDVAILSAIMGNAVTLVMVAVAAPLFFSLHVGLEGRAFLWSILFVAGTSALAMTFRSRLFSLPRKELRFVAGIHLIRILADLLLAAILWHALLPVVALHWWVLLATLRQLVSRLPFVPNKELVFAGLAAFFVGRDTDMAMAMALMATIMLTSHVLAGMALGIHGLWRDSR
mgnify:CR=1 FL=1